VVERGIIADIPSGWWYYYTSGELAPTAVHYALIGPQLGASYPIGPDKRIACYMYGEKLPTPPTAFFVTSFKLCVTCQDCLELIHA
jgi:hypothetical protein